MRFGPNIILRIPSSGRFIRIKKQISGNTFGARWWTDGKMIAPMWFDDSALLRHPTSGEVFWLVDCEEIAVEPNDERKSQYKKMPRAETVDEADLLAQLELPSLSNEREKHVRIRLWWLWNDSLRNDRIRPSSGKSGLLRWICPWKSANDQAKEEEARRSAKARFDGNLRKLIPLLKLDHDDERLMAAECHREIGEHEEAARLLDWAYDDYYRASCDAIRNTNEQRMTQVVEIIR